MEAKADISLEEEKSATSSALEEKLPSLSVADEIDLNSEDEFKGGLTGASLRETRNEPDDIFEDIPENKDTRTEPYANTLVKEPAMMSAKPQALQVCPSFFIILH